MIKWLTSCLLPRQRETKCRQKKSPGVGWDSLKFSFHSLLLLIMLSHQAFVLVLSRIIQTFDRAIVISDKVWRTSTLFASPLNWFLRNIALPITNKRLPGPASERGGYQRPSDRHQWLYRKLKISLAEKYLDSTEKRLHGKIFRIQKFLDSKVPSLDCGFKISGDMTKPGYFHFGFVLLCVNGKTKRY